MLVTLHVALGLVAMTTPAGESEDIPRSGSRLGDAPAATVSREHQSPDAVEEEASSPARIVGWGVRGAFSGAALFGRPQTSAYQPFGGEAQLAVSYAPFRRLAVELEGTGVGFVGRSGTSGSAVLAMLGPWLDAFDLNWATVYASAHGGGGFTGGLSRLAFDAAVGLEWRLSALRLGPEIQYVDMISQAHAGEVGGDARLSSPDFPSGGAIGPQSCHHRDAKWARNRSSPRSQPPTPPSRGR
jgi:hypothetical protein